MLQFSIILHKPLAKKGFGLGSGFGYKKGFGFRVRFFRQKSKGLRVRFGSVRFGLVPRKRLALSMGKEFKD